MKIYDIVRDIICDKTGVLSDNPSFDFTFNAFVVARYLSMRPEYMKYADWMNMHSNLLSKEAIYKYLVRNVPKSRNGFIEYLKRKKTSDKKKDDAADEEQADS